MDMSPRSGQPIIARFLTISGIVTIVIAAVLAVAVEPLLALVALIGVIDLALARGFASGRLGAPAPGAEIAEELAPGDASRDPDYNPYARED